MVQRKNPTINSNNAIYISQAEAFASVERYLQEKVNGFEGVSVYYGQHNDLGIKPSYIMAVDFLRYNLTLPLRYYDSNGAVFFIKAVTSSQNGTTTSSYTIDGKCSGFENRNCIPYNSTVISLLSDKLVYVFDAGWIYRGSDGRTHNLPDGFYVDASNGNVVYTTFHCPAQKQEWCK